MQMRLLPLFLLLASNTFCQNLAHVQTEDAERHLLISHSPVYPGLAQQTRVTGDVLLEITIAANGKTSVRRVISGHPLLIPATIDAVQGWQFQPFVIDGKPTAVVTVVTVPFGEVGSQKVTDQTQLRFQYDFWTAENMARAALAKGDLQSAEEHLIKARDLLAPFMDEPRNSPERLQWFLDSGDLSKAKQMYDEAEQSYRKGLELVQKRDKEAPETALMFAKLGVFYSEQKRYDLARENLIRSIAVYRKNFNRVGSDNPSARQIYGVSIAKELWILSKVEQQAGNSPEAIKQCRAAEEFKDFLNAAERDLIVSGCKTMAEPH